MKRNITKYAKSAETDSFSGYKFLKSYTTHIKQKLIIESSDFFQEEKSRTLLGVIFEKFSLKYLLSKDRIKLNFEEKTSIQKIKKDIIINDPDITLEYISSLFNDPKSIQDLISNISDDNLDPIVANRILNEFHNDLIKMYVALNSDKIDVEFVTKRFKHYYSTAEKYNGELRGQKVRYDHLMFRQAFLKNPDKFRQIEEFIPVNLGFSIKMSIPEGKNPVLCHSIGGEVTENSLIYSHELVACRVSNATNFSENKICVYFDQTDKESTDIQEMFRLIGEKPQNISDASILNEEQMTRTDWDIKNKHSRKFHDSENFNTQQYVVYGNFSSEGAESKSMLLYQKKIYERLNRKIKDLDLSSEDRQRYIDAYNRFYSYFSLKNVDSILVIKSSQEYGLGYRRSITMNFFNDVQ